MCPALTCIYMPYVSMCISHLPSGFTVCGRASHWGLGFETPPTCIQLLPMALAPSSCPCSDLHKDQHEKSITQWYRRSDRRAGRAITVHGTQRRSLRHWVDR